MMLLLKIIGLWLLLSCTLGPCLTWLFFYSKRQREQTKDRRLLTDIPSSGLMSAALLLVAAGSMTTGASAITVELAKKCQALTQKAFPPRVVGNPAAGSAKGSGRDEQAYFNKCVKNGGNVDNASSKEAK